MIWYVSLLFLYVNVHFKSCNHDSRFFHVPQRLQQIQPVQSEQPVQSVPTQSAKPLQEWAIECQPIQINYCQLLRGIALNHQMLMTNCVVMCFITGIHTVGCFVPQHDWLCLVTGVPRNDINESMTFLFAWGLVSYLIKFTSHIWNMLWKVPFLTECLSGILSMSSFCRHFGLYTGPVPLHPNCP